MAKGQARAARQPPRYGLAVGRALAIALLLAVVPAAEAMGCTIAAQTPRQQVHGAKVVVYVSVLSVRTLGQTRTGATEWEARVRRVKTFKGRPARVFRVRSNTDSGTCGLAMFEVGQRVGLLLHGRRPPFDLRSGSTISLADLRRARQ